MAASHLDRTATPSQKRLKPVATGALTGLLALITPLYPSSRSLALLLSQQTVDAHEPMIRAWLLQLL